MENPNDAAAPFYDIVYDEYINKNITKKEVDFVCNHIKKGNVLDIACGTGRHMIPLLKKGYSVTGVDASSGMLKELKKKLKENNLKAVVVRQDIKSFKSNKQFDGIIGFWNSVNEIIINKRVAIKLFDKFYKLLAKDGVVIIELSKPPKSVFSYTREVKHREWNYKITFRLLSLDKNKVSKDEEILEIIKNGKRVRKLKSKYVHKWWAESELKRLFEKTGFSSIKTYNTEGRQSSETQRTLLVAKK